MSDLEEFQKLVDYINSYVISSKLQNIDCRYSINKNKNMSILVATTDLEFSIVLHSRNYVRLNVNVGNRRSKLKEALQRYIENLNSLNHTTGSVLFDFYFCFDSVDQTIDFFNDFFVEAEELDFKEIKK